MATSRERLPGLMDEGLTVREAARTLNISTQRVYQLLDELDIPPPTRRE